MKKIIRIVLATVLVLAMFVPFTTVMAMTPVGEVSTNYGTVTIDGKFSADKWAAASTYTVDSSNTMSWSGDNMTASIKMYSLWDETGLYLAGEVKDSTFTYSNDNGYNGDAIQFSLDVGQICVTTAQPNAIFYSMGCSEDASGFVVVRQTSANDGNVADGENGLKFKPAKSADGWTFELLLPWTMLNEDMNLKAGQTFTPEAGGKINCMECYLDKDGSPDVLLSAAGATKPDDAGAMDWSPNGAGITFVLQAKAEVPTATEAPATEASAVSPDIQPAVTEAPMVSAGTTVITAPATGDISMVFVFVAIVAAAIGFLTFKKSKNAV